MNFDHLGFRSKIADRTIHVGVIGLGYVGLPLALTFIERAKARVTGFDVDAKKVQTLNAGDCYVKHIPRERVREAIGSNRFGVTCHFERLSEPDALFVAVPTPLTREREPDLKYVVQTAESIAHHLRPGQLVVLESTTYPGTTEELVLPILEGSGLKAGRDFLLAYSPEREDPGNQSYGTAQIPKLVSGIDPPTTELAAALYEIAVERVVPVSSTRVAEAAKLSENVFRAVNIALVNELKMLFDKMGIDVWEVLDAAATKPFGFMRFDPGPGFGGHCIALDPFYLAYKAKQCGAQARFVELAGEINVSMPEFVIAKLEEGLVKRGKSLAGSLVLILGIAYKRDVGDVRESPAFEVMQRLREAKVELAYHDPFVPVVPPTRSWPSLQGQESIALSPEILGRCDAVLLLTDHRCVDYDLVLESAPLIIDTRGVFRAAHSNVVKA